MLRDILVHLDGTNGDETRLSHAQTISREFEAFLTGIYLNVARVPASAGYAGFGAGQVVSDYHATALARGDDIMADLKERFEKLDSAAHELRRYDVFMGEAAGVLCSEGRTGDLFVCAQPYGKLAEMSELTEATIFGSGRGVLLVPDASEPPENGYKTVVVAWRNTKEAARSVFEAMPFLHKADKVVVVMVDEHGAPEQFGEEPGADIARHLSRHDCAVELRHLTGWDDVGQALLNEAEKLGADMLVMGAYGHSRIRQWILGGVTRHVLAKSPIPVLTAH